MDKTFAGKFYKLITIPEWDASVENADIIVCGIPLENTPTCRPGAKLGTCVRLPYMAIEPYFPDIDIDVLTDTNVCDLGDMFVPLGDSNLAVETIENVILELRQRNPKAKFLVIGGDHTIPYPVVKALKPKSVINFDTHLDILPEWLGVKYTHTSQNYYIREELGCDLLFVGINSWEKEAFEYVKKHNIPVITAEEIEFDKMVFEKVKHYISQLSDPVYISIDMDVLKDIDNVEVKGCLSMYLLHKILKYIFTYKQVIGVDVCELCPDRILDRQSFVGLTTIYYIVGLMTKFSKETEANKTTTKGD